MPNANRQLVTVPDREPLTELEARRVGIAAQRLARFRSLLRNAHRGGSVNVTPGAGKMMGENLGSADVAAVLGLLIEREELFLASMNVQIERPE